MSAHPADDSQDHPSLPGLLGSHPRWWLAGSLLSLVLAYGLLFGWHSDVIGQIVATPLVYRGDGLGHAWILQRVVEGWAFENPRSGYPFGSTFLDHPASDLGNYLAFKALGVLGSDFVAGLNLYIILTFPAAFVAAFAVLLGFRLPALSAFGGALLFAFLPFHFLRLGTLGHVFYLAYFVVPLYFHYALRIDDGSFAAGHRWAGRRLGISLLTLAALSCFGVYYALFGCIIIGLSGITGFIRRQSLGVLRNATLALAAVTAGVILNTAPNLAHIAAEGRSPEAVQRQAAEAELYGLKLMELILPRPGHRVSDLANVTRAYTDATSLRSGNTTATLGVVGSGGLIVLAAIALLRLSGSSPDPRLTWLAALVGILFLFGTVGGLGSLFAFAVSPLIRGWNRISVFIAFGSIAAIFLSIHLLRAGLGTGQWRSTAQSLGVCSVVALGLWDQTAPGCSSCLQANRAKHELSRDFIHSVEATLPQGAAIYQLPYMPFPEVPALHELDAYEPLSGFLYSKQLRWSFAGMKGRIGDLFYRSLAGESPARQIEVLKRLGFAGIYIDRRGYADAADGLIAEFSSLLGTPPELVRKDGKVVFFKLSLKDPVDLAGLPSAEILKRSGYPGDASLHPNGGFVQGIDFSRARWPAFVMRISGLSDAEGWGRWSDARKQRAVRIEAFQPFPERFRLVMEIGGFGPNAGQEMEVRVGATRLSVRIPDKISEVSIEVDTRGESVTAIEFRPPSPVSPRQLGLSDDDRKLGVGFARLSIRPLGP